MSGDASWWTSVVDAMPPANVQVLCLTEEGSVALLRARRGVVPTQWLDDVNDSGRVIAWTRVPHVDFKALHDKFLEAQHGD